MSIPLIYQDEVAETIIVKRTQRVHIPYNKTISYFCHLSKNLWNQIHHIVYGYYKKYGQVPSYEETDKILNDKNYLGYKKDMTNSKMLVTNSKMLSKDVTTQEKTAKNNLVIKKKTKKKIIDKKAINERHKAITEKLMNDVSKGKISIGYNPREYPEESKVVITKEERAERFKRLRAMMQEMMKKQNE